MAKARIALLTALLAALGFGALPFLAGCSGHGKNDIDRLAWLSGCWEGKSDGAVVQEQWSKPAGGTLLGTGRRIAGGKTVFHEYMHIGETNSGLLFVAHPGGGEGTPFRLQKAGKNKAVFINNAHEFPRVITYQRKGNSLLVLAEGTREGRETADKVKLKRAACD